VPNRRGQAQQRSRRRAFEARHRRHRGYRFRMLLRDEGERGVLAIGQASHAWISGQLARAWGNDQFGAVAPREEVCLAAEQHDVGMAMWDLDPDRNPTTGLPLSFMEMPIEVHLGLWREAPRHLLSQSRYAALLVSMHGTRLYKQRNLDALEPEQAESVRTYLDAQRRLHQELIASLGADPSEVARNSDLIWTWDGLSLAVCLDWAPYKATGVPSADDPVAVELTPAGERAIVFAPWPFAGDRLTVRADGRRLTQRYDSDKALRDALASARWETVAFELRRA
jgi:hypothetical protein